MPAFRPDPTTSPIELANWLVLRVVAVVVLVTYAGAVLLGLLSTIFPVLGVQQRLFVVQIGTAFPALWIGVWLLFEALDVFVDAKLDAATGESTAEE